MEGFEPPIPLPVYLISNQAPSARLGHISKTGHAGSGVRPSRQYPSAALFGAKTAAQARVPQITPQLELLFRRKMAREAPIIRVLRRHSWGAPMA